MKILLVLAALFALSFYVVKYHSPFQTEVTDPYYVQIRLKMQDIDVQMVGVGKMYSYEDCQGRAAIIWADMLKHMGQVKLDTQCKKQVPDKYLKLFENKQAPATYVAFDKGDDKERDGRFLIYGVPASEVFKACETITKSAKETYSGAVYCVQGSVG